MNDKSLKGGFEMLVISKNRPYFIGKVAGLVLESSKGVEYQIYGLMGSDRTERIPLSLSGPRGEVERAMLNLQKQCEELYLNKTQFLVHFSDQKKDLGISVEVLGKEVNREC